MSIPDYLSIKLSNGNNTRLPTDKTKQSLPRTPMGTKKHLYVLFEFIFNLFSPFRTNPIVNFSSLQNDVSELLISINQSS